MKVNNLKPTGNSSFLSLSLTKSKDLQVSKFFLHANLIIISFFGACTSMKTGLLT